MHISKEKYLSLVHVKAITKATLPERLAELGSLIGAWKSSGGILNLTRSRRSSKDQGYSGVSCIVPILGINSFLTSDNSISNWHYDRTAECLLVNLQGVSHEHVNSLLYKIYVNDTENSAVQNNANLAAEFVEGGLGWFKTSEILCQPVIGENVKLTAKEKAAFQRIEFQTTL
jgi:hypothetical protein